MKSFLTALCVGGAAMMLLIGMPRAVRASPSVAHSNAAIFEFRSDFWYNLHHSLYAFATHDPAAEKVRHVRLAPEDVAIRDALPDAERAQWQEAVRWYALTLSNRDLLFDDEMIAIGEALRGSSEHTPSASNVPPRLQSILRRVAPIYRAQWWQRHNDANEAWRRRVEPLLIAKGPAVATELARAYGATWFDAPLPVALTAYANWAGAYTSLRPMRVTVATTDPRNQGSAAFEILMHEASHGLAGPLQQKLATLTVKENGRTATVRPELWHEILFYITGRVVEDAVPGHVAYADRNELWRVAWPGQDRDLISRNLDPVLVGSDSLDQALETLVSALASAQMSEPSAKSRP